MENSTTDVYVDVDMNVDVDVDARGQDILTI